jgi:RimJ/RimL family protein N-acetyltransferase
MEINCGNFILRTLRIEDADSMAKYANNRNIWINLRDIMPFPYSLNDAINFIEFCKVADTVFNLGIIHNEECIGIIGFNYLPDVYRKTAEFGYWLGEPFWNRGIMTMAVKEFSGYVFDNFDIIRLHCGVFEWNKASMRVLEKAGYIFDGIFKKSVTKNGKTIDEYRYSLLKNV